jgi:hypothetical protein
MPPFQAEQIAAIERRLSRLEKAVQDLVDRETIQKAVHDAIRQRGPVLPLGWLAKTAVVVVAVCAVGSLALQAFGR